MSAFANSKLYNACDKLAMFLLCVFMADCAVLGSGRFLSVGPLGLRMVLLGVMMVISLPLILAQLHRLIRLPLLWLLAGFLVWLAVSAVIGFVNGNSRAMLLSDLKGFAYFISVLPALCVLRSKERIHKLMKTAMYACCALSFLTAVLVPLYRWAPQMFNNMVSLDPEHHITMFAAVSSKIPRLFYKSTPYLLCGCAFPIYFSVVEHGEKRRWQYPVIIGFALFSLLLSYTRSIYLAVFLAAAALIIALYLTAKKVHRVQLGKLLGASVLSCVVLICAYSVVLQANYFGYALDRLGVTFQNPDAGSPGGDSSGDTNPTNPTGSTEHFQELTTMSDQLRADTKAELFENIKSAPLFGCGLGKTLAVRNHNAHEYIYLDIIMKTGIFGLLLFFAPAVFIVIATVKAIKSHPDAVKIRAPWLAVLLGFISFSYFNPYMNAALGIFFYCCCIAVFYAETDIKNQITSEETL